MCQRMNVTLKTKWLWRFANEDDAMWKKAIVMKYWVDNFDLWSKNISCAHGVDIHYEWL